MATQTTGGGSTTSFTNTPQAKDDNYLFLEDALRNDASLYSETTKIITLDVMSNDLGGNAKTLFSVEDGDGNALTADYELLCKDVNAAGVSNWELTLGGNWVRINNGKIEYVIADGSGIAGQGRSVDSLTDGQNFLSLSATRPLVAPGTPFAPDLQSWIRNENLAPDWLRVGTDIVGGTTFNAAFTLTGVVSEPGSLLLVALAFLGMAAGQRRRSTAR